MTIFISSLRLFAVDYSGKMLAGSVYSSKMLNSFLLSVYSPSIDTSSSLSRNLDPTPSTNFKKS